MSRETPRPYRSSYRLHLASTTRQQILKASAELFKRKGIDGVTIQEVAKAASTSASSIYAIFKSKKGILRELIDKALSPEKFKDLVTAVKNAPTSREKLQLSAKIARQIYDAEKEMITLLSEASALDSEFQEVEKHREERRYQRQKETVELIAGDKQLKKGLTLTQVRDILWAFTSRNFYRLFVINRNWSSDTFEVWLAQQLIDSLLTE